MRYPIWRSPQIPCLEVPEKRGMWGGGQGRQQIPREQISNHIGRRMYKFNPYWKQVFEPYGKIMSILETTRLEAKMVKKDHFG